MKDVFIGIGSNVDREENITSCINELRNVFSNLEISPVYETSSMGFEGPNFFNLVCKFSTDEELLNLKKMLNKACIRGKTKRGGRNTCCRFRKKHLFETKHPRHLRKANRRCAEADT